MSRNGVSKPDRIRLRLRVTPNAAIDRVEGEELRGDGSAVLRVRVRAAPDKGKANAAVIALLAEALEVPRSAIGIVAGETARLKTVEIAGDPASLDEKLRAIRDERR